MHLAEWNYEQALAKLGSGGFLAAVPHTACLGTGLLLLQV